MDLYIDETNLYEYAGAVDYVFVGQILEADYAIQDEGSTSAYRVQVRQNLKGALVEEIQCRKHGGILPDGTLSLYASDRVQDSGLPEVGGTYILMAYGQPDGSLLLSELYSRVTYTQASLSAYQDYVEHQVPYQRERFPSSYDAAA